MIRARVEYCWVPDGAGTALLGQPQSDFPGYGPTLSTGFGAVGAAQTISDQVGEIVPGGDSPSSANFQTALNLAATDLQTRLTTANANPGVTSGTLLSVIQAWSTGGP